MPRKSAMLFMLWPWRLKVDVDKNAAIADQYGVEYIPATLVLDATGKAVADAVGFLPPEGVSVTAR